MKRVLFVCTANSARSQMAEALLRHMAGDQFEVFSAGTHPEAVDPRTLEALQGVRLADGPVGLKVGGQSGRSAL